MDTEVIDIKLDKGQEVIVGQGNFSLKTTDDIARVMLTSAPNIKVGVAMNDGGMKITRSSGNDEKLEKKAAEICYRIGAGHVFVVILEGAFPVNVLNDLQHVHGVCSIYAATANTLQLILVKTEQGKGIIGVVDGASPQSVEDEPTKEERRKLLRKIGYRLG
ncbi:MAG: adenosine monophosphate-protein transferase [Candidatus Diapherotrites archaeon]|nr:adenosine monophosphate-protein transferase [Candidatus Diapherotrites archaeon]